jgi:UPF0755 protein
MTPPAGVPTPGGRPDDRRHAPARGRAAPREGGSSSLERTRRLLDQRRAQLGRDGGSGDAPGGDGGGGGPRPPRRTGRGGGSGRPGRSEVFRRRRIAALAAGGLLLVGLWLLSSLFQPFKGEGEGQIQVSIPNGAGISEIGDVLEREGVISSGFFFELRARLAGAGEDLKAGDYELREEMSYSAALDALAAGGLPARVVNVTIPEGRARSEVAPIVEDAGLEGNYEQATESSRLIDPADYGAEDAESLEGFLFPATYELKPSATVDDVVEKQLQAFGREFRKVDMSEAEAAGLSEYDVLTIASMVERETLVPKERPVVASVIYNRLEVGEPLGIDATTRFAVDNWTDPLTQSELAIDSPYNTRENAGLPPGPIGSPGADSIEAAANPDDTDFLFYVVKPGTCGEHQFTETSEEFEAAVAEYDQARAEAGGESPTDCPG